MTKFATSTGTLEIKHTDDRVMIVLVNDSTHHEVGISIPKTHVWTFINRWFYSGKNESIGITVKGDKLIITVTLNFGKEVRVVTTIKRIAWHQIQQEIKCA